MTPGQLAHLRELAALMREAQWGVEPRAQIKPKPEPEPEAIITFKRELSESDLELVQLPRVMYDILVDQSRKNAQTLRVLLTYAAADRKAVPAHSIYAALCGVDKDQAIRELKDWVNG